MHRGDRRRLVENRFTNVVLWSIAHAVPERSEGRSSAQGCSARVVGVDAAQELLKPKRGRPRSTNPKEHVNIRLDADVLRAFRSRGRGWQTRLNSALRDWLSTHA